MMPIKYRAWHKTEKKIFDVLCIDLDAEFGGVWRWGKAYHDHDTGEHEADKDFIPWEQVELMQFTGLMDKHGKDIYEGDIISHDEIRRWPKTVHTSTAKRIATYPMLPLIVKWNKEQVGFDPFVSEDDEKGTFFIPERIEVIGNIYENPELSRKEGTNETRTTGSVS